MDNFYLILASVIAFICFLWWVDERLRNQYKSWPYKELQEKKRAYTRLYRSLSAEERDSKTGQNIRAAIFRLEVRMKELEQGA